MAGKRQSGPLGVPPRSPKALCSRVSAAWPRAMIWQAKSRSPPEMVSWSCSYLGRPRDMCMPVEWPWRHMTRGILPSEAVFGISRWHTASQSGSLAKRNRVSVKAASSRVHSTRK